ncbi:hypothetical protein LIPSTDRAFT_108358 [Lipomyces starkeyi NRRL Y-11557]|uniref:Uncharacterized protein n=1 Tax=Lipomyces starkeyi NRRL Y-11557 TaxID=675824 RepID=A0A1E3PUZ7_LIPST|nr:hypothetical protein LIPSTDRAFT_108358 [Lipomyces starkeyi NRRL Y-11557]
MSTTWRENYSFRWIFKDRRGRTGPCKGAGLCRPWNPSSGQTDFRGAFQTELPYSLGSTNPCPTAICTRGRSTRAHAQGFVTDPHACLLVGASFLPQRRADSDFHGHRRAV